MPRILYDDETQLPAEDLTRKQFKQRALNRFKSSIQQQNANYSPKDLKAMDMMNLKRNFLITTDKTLSSERARNFQIELVQPT